MSGDDPDGRRDVSRGEAPGDDLSARLKRLGAELDTKAASSERATAPRRSASDTSAVGQAFRYSAEFVAGVIAGAAVGWLVDRLAGTTPWGLIICLILGFCAGMLNLLRVSGAVKPARSRDDRTGADL